MTTPNQVNVSKDMRGNWRAENDYEIGDNRVLRISTHKVYSGALVTSATVHKKEANFIVHEMHSDYCKRLKGTLVRVTSKAVASQQSEALLSIEQLKKEAIQFYASRNKSEVTA